MPGCAKKGLLAVCIIGACLLLLLPGCAAASAPLSPSLQLLATRRSKHACLYAHICICLLACVSARPRACLQDAGAHQEFEAELNSHPGGMYPGVPNHAFDAGAAMGDRAAALRQICGANLGEEGWGG